MFLGAISVVTRGLLILPIKQAKNDIILLFSISIFEDKKFLKTDKA